MQAHHIYIVNIGLYIIINKKTLCTTTSSFKPCVHANITKKKTKAIECDVHPRKLTNPYMQNTDVITYKNA